MEQDQAAIPGEPHAPSRLRRILRWLAYGVLAVLVVIVGFFAFVIYLAANSDVAKNQPSERAVRTEARKGASAVAAVRLEEMRWTAKGGGSLMEVTFKLINDNSFPVKDIKVACATYGQSGTVINTNVKTVYQVVPALGMITVRDLSMGFIDRQSQAADCRAIDVAKSN